MDLPGFDPAGSAFQSYVKQPDFASLLKAPSDTDSFALDLPFEKLSIFVRRYEDCHPLGSVPLYAIAEIGVVPKSKGIGPPQVVQPPIKLSDPPKFVALPHSAASLRSLRPGQNEDALVKILESTVPLQNPGQDGEADPPMSSENNSEGAAKSPDLRKETILADPPPETAFGDSISASKHTPEELDNEDQDDSLEEPSDASHGTNTTEGHAERGKNKDEDSDLGEQRPGLIIDPPKSTDRDGRALDVFAESSTTGPRKPVVDGAAPTPGESKAPGRNQKPVSTRLKRTLDIGDTTGSNPSRDTAVLHLPLGMVATDHCGYASFDLGYLQTQDLVQGLHRNQIVHTRRFYKPEDGDDGFQVTIGLVNLWILPFGDIQLLTNALTVGDIGTSYITLRIDLDNDALGSRPFSKSTWMPAMQNPGILDYRMSPGSFSLGSPTLLVGSGDAACETLTPSNLTPQTFRFRQAARLLGLGTKPGAEVGDGTSIDYKLGFIFEYRTEWHPIGHSLGNLSYSLPLAPGEVVKLAVVDWERTDTASRQERTGLSESLLHDTVQDRSLTESVGTLLTEWQQGGSVLGGVAGAGAAAGVGPGAGAGGGVAALGGAFTTTAGTRDLTAKTVQRIADAFHQATSSIRELRSTVVVQSKQQESSTVQTRTVANYNHGHALTILYYEVLRHFRMVTRLTQSQPALYLDYSQRMHKFDDARFLLAFRRELENCLLDERHRGGFDAIARIQQSEDYHQSENKTTAKTAGPDGNSGINQLLITITTGKKFGSGTDGWVYVDLVFTDNKTYTTNQIEPNDRQLEDRYLGHPNVSNFEAGDVGVYGLEANLDNKKHVFPWNRLRGFVIGLKVGGLAPEWFIEHVKLEGITAQGEKISLYSEYYRKWHGGGTTTELLVKRPPVERTQPTAKKSGDTADLLARDLLIEHLERHRHHYNRCLWLAEDPNATIAWLEDKTVHGQSVLDRIQDRALEVSGNWAAFPLLESDEFARAIRSSQQQGYSSAYLEQLVSLPTRGLFAEAKLGHCNATEVIDDTRFWKWHEAPIPHQAPEITGADAGSRYQAPVGTNPTPLPQNVVNVVSPQHLPDPTALVEALKVTGTPEIFRDSSGIQQAASLLSTLSQNATSLTSQGLATTRLDSLLKSIRSDTNLDDGQKNELAYSAYKTAIGGSAAIPQKPVNAVPNPLPPAGGGAAGGGTASPPNPLPIDGPKPPSDPPQASPSPGTRKSQSPSPKPPSNKPKPARSNPSFTDALLFQFNFNHGFRSTYVTGDITIDIVPGPPDATAPPTKGLRIGYRPGTGGPQVPEAEGRSMEPIFNGSVFIQTSKITTPGTFELYVRYTMDEFSQSEILGRAFEPASSMRFESGPGYYQWHFKDNYDLPPAGNRLVYEVTPKYKTITIKAKEKVELEAELGAKIPSWAKIVDVSLGGKVKASGEAESSQEFSITYPTGDILVEPAGGASRHREEKTG